ncbi:MAG: hypothetical protein KDI92_07475 [Xanthomonadales bacterium]|nr:hypothetical protein [Xanthomonadales bacterium]
MKLPKKLELLIESGFWPNKQNVNQQYIESLVNLESLKTLIPDEIQIYFYNPPFYTVKESIEFGNDYWNWPEVKPSLSEIDIDKTLIIGDFGLGSDTLLALDYSKSMISPSVIRFKWFDENPIKNNKWLVVCESFDEFLKKLKIET